ncbi:MAG: GNAT family N-acetyltransferase [Microbacteriaceae bacterium]|nr:GNAT family N-acetyltransferase [Microbacteriaceae bacterium]
MHLDYTTDSYGNPLGIAVPSLEPVERPDGAPLIGDRVKLERLSADDHAHDLFQALTADPHPSLWTYMPQGPFETERDLTAWITGIEHSTDPLYYAIVDGETHRAIGIAAYLRIDTQNRTIEVGWLTFSSQLRRSTRATEAMYLMGRHAFDRGFRRYEWKCNALNAPSIAAAERLGFSFEGVFRNAVIVKGRNRDTAWFAITDSDWPAVAVAHKQWLSPENFDETGNQRTSLRDATFPLLHSHWPTLTITR